MPKSRNISVLTMGENVPFWWLHHGFELIAGLEHPIWELPTEFCKRSPILGNPHGQQDNDISTNVLFIAAAGAISID